MISPSFLFPEELKSLLYLLKVAPLDSKWDNSVFYETRKTNKIDIPAGVRCDMVRAYFRYQLMKVYEYSDRMYHQRVKTGEVTRNQYYQYQIILYKKVLYMCKVVHANYGVDLDSEKKVAEKMIDRIREVFTPKISKFGKIKK